MKTQWNTNLCGCFSYDFRTCLCGMFCPHMAYGLSKSNTDGSMFCFNFCCVAPVLSRYIIRKGYHIEGNAGSDCLLTFCCFQLTACQLLDETKKRGIGVPELVQPRSEPKSTTSSSEGGEQTDVTQPGIVVARHEKRAWKSTHQDTNCNDPIDMLCATICCSVESANTFHVITGAPMWLALYSNICTNQNILRRQYDLPGNELCHDCIIPFCGMLIPCSSCCTYFPKINTRLLDEVAIRGRPSKFMVGDDSTLTYDVVYPSRS